MKYNTAYISSKTPTLKELQEKVGGDIELIPLSHRAQMIVNENGKLLDLPLNQEATGLLQSYKGKNDVIVGNAVVLMCNAMMK